MTTMDILVLSQAVSWLVIITLATLLVATVRQIGVLYERVAPLGALMLPTALGPGERVPRLETVDIDGQPHIIGGERQDGRAQLLLFVAPECPMCRKLLDALPSFIRAEHRRIDLVFIVDRASDAAAIADRLPGRPIVADARLGQTLRIGKLPYGILVDASGTLVSGGLVNSREHLESLVVAAELGVGTLQQFLATSSAGRPTRQPSEAAHG